MEIIVLVQNSERYLLKLKKIKEDYNPMRHPFSYLSTDFFSSFVWHKFLYFLNKLMYRIGMGLSNKIAGWLDFPNNFGLAWVKDPGDFPFREVLTRFTRDMEFLEVPRWRAEGKSIDIDAYLDKYIPNNFYEVLFGMLPEVTPITRVFFLDQETGYYNFYVQDHLNGVMLPDCVSEFIQIRLNYQTDYSDVSAVREALFLMAWMFSEIWNLRCTMSMFIFINPYVLPWNIITTITEWMEESYSSIMPIVPLFDLSLLSCRLTIGRVLDTLNNLVLTFPYLPSEGVRAYVFDAKYGDKPGIVFRGLPRLWYKHGIPNELRQHWYYYRKDILKYLQKSYHGLQFLPDEIIEQINSQRSQITDINSYILDNYHHLFSNHNFQLKEFFETISSFLHHYISF